MPSSSALQLADLALTWSNKTGDGETYFALAEVEMPETDTVPPPPPEILAPHVLLLAPRNDQRFTSKRLSDRAHAERLLADVRTKGEAA